MRMKLQNVLLGLLATIFIGLQPVEGLSVISHNPDGSANESKGCNNDLIKLSCKIGLAVALITAGMVVVTTVKQNSGQNPGYDNRLNTTENQTISEIVNITNSSPVNSSSYRLGSQKRAVKHK